MKGSQRDWQQVMANGGLAAMASALYYYTGAPIWLLGACICIAAANSDTWASEVGSMSKRKPIVSKRLGVLIGEHQVLLVFLAPVQL